jgi:translation initiation factor 5
MMLNIPSYKEDPAYRYKMPALITKVEGRGNGIKTNLVNLAEVAKSLKVPIEYPLKFFGAELGAQTQFKKIKGEQRAILNGSVTTKDLQQLLDKFIEKFVLCPRCSYPEIHIVVTKKGILFSDCSACGEHRQMDNSHKICTYITKHPPEVPKSVAKAIQETATKKKGLKKKKDEDLGPDNATIELDSPEVLEAIQRLQAIEYVDAERLAEEVRNISVAAGFDIDMKIYVVLQSLYNTRLSNLLKNKEMAKLLTVLASDHQEDLIVAFAATYIPQPDFHKFIPTVLKQLYDIDALQEDFLINWKHDQVIFNEESTVYNSRYVSKLRKISEPFLAWLE